MASDGDRTRTALAARIELLLVRLRFSEAQRPGAVEKAVREFEREAGQASAADWLFGNAVRNGPSSGQLGKKRWTAFGQDAEVGVKWKTNA